MMSISDKCYDQLQDWRPTWNERLMERGTMQRIPTLQFNIDQDGGKTKQKNKKKDKMQSGQESWPKSADPPSSHAPPPTTKASETAVSTCNRGNACVQKRTYRVVLVDHEKPKKQNRDEYESGELRLKPRYRYNDEEEEEIMRQALEEHIARRKYDEESQRHEFQRMARQALMEEEARRIERYRRKYLMEDRMRQRMLERARREEEESKLTWIPSNTYIREVERNRSCDRMAPLAIKDAEPYRSRYEERRIPTYQEKPTRVRTQESKVDYSKWLANVVADVDEEEEENRQKERRPYYSWESNDSCFFQESPNSQSQRRSVRPDTHVPPYRQEGPRVVKRVTSDGREKTCRKREEHPNPPKREPNPRKREPNPPKREPNPPEREPNPPKREHKQPEPKKPPRPIYVENKQPPASPVSPIYYKRSYYILAPSSQNPGEQCTIANNQCIPPENTMYCQDNCQIQSPVNQGCCQMTSSVSPGACQFRPQERQCRINSCPCPARPRSPLRNIECCPRNTNDISFNLNNLNCSYPCKYDTKLNSNQGYNYRQRSMYCNQNTQQRTCSLGPNQYNCQRQRTYSTPNQTTGQNRLFSCLRTNQTGSCRTRANLQSILDDLSPWKTGLNQYPRPSQYEAGADLSPTAGQTWLQQNENTTASTSPCVSSRQPRTNPVQLNTQQECHTLYNCTPTIDPSNWQNPKLLYYETLEEAPYIPNTRDYSKRKPLPEQKPSYSEFTPTHHSSVNYSNQEADQRTCVTQNNSSSRAANYESRSRRLPQSVIWQDDLDFSDNDFFEPSYTEYQRRRQEQKHNYVPRKKWESKDMREKWSCSIS